MTDPHEPEVASTTMICAIPTAPASADNLSLQQVYDNQAQYLGTVRHRPTHTDLAQMAVLHGFRPALPVSAIQWTNRYAQRVILIVASRAEPQFHHCDHGRSSVVGRRPFEARCGRPPSPPRTSTTRSCGAAGTATASRWSTWALPEPAKRLPGSSPTTTP